MLLNIMGLLRRFRSLELSLLDFMMEFVNLAYWAMGFMPSLSKYFYALPIGEMD